MFPNPIRLLTERHPDSGLDAEETDKNALKDLVSEWDEKHFTYEVSVRYYTAVVEAVRAVDPHHLVLGSRLHGAAKSNKYLNSVELISHQITSSSNIRYIIRGAHDANLDVLSFNWF